MEDNEFWLKVMKAIIGGICFLGLTIGGCTANRHYQVRALVQTGTDPIGAKCAIEGETGQTSICIQRAMQK